MYDIAEDRNGQVVGVTVSGTVTHEDYQQIIPRLEQRINEHGKIRIMFEMRDFHGWKLGAAWDDLKFDAKHAKDAERVAVVGDKTWEKWMATLGKPFTSAEIRFFNTGDRDAAWAWLREGLGQAD